MNVSGEKVRLAGQFEILAQDNFFSSKVRLGGQFFRSSPTGRTPVYQGQKYLGLAVPSHAHPCCILYGININTKN